MFQAQQSHVAELVSYLDTAWTPSIKEHAEWFEHHKEDIYVVSGGFSDYIVPLASKIGIKSDHVHVNRFIYDEVGAITGFADILLSQPQGKVQQIKSLGFTRPVIMIGDGYTDFEVRKHGQASAFWAFAENVSRPQVVTVADRVLDSWVVP